MFVVLQLIRSVQVYERMISQNWAHHKTSLRITSTLTIIPIKNCSCHQNPNVFGLVQWIATFSVAQYFLNRPNLLDRVAARYTTLIMLCFPMERKYLNQWVRSFHCSILAKPSVSIWKPIVPAIPEVRKSWILQIVLGIILCYAAVSRFAQLLKMNDQVGLYRFIHLYYKSAGTFANL